MNTSITEKFSKSPDLSNWVEDFEREPESSLFSHGAFKYPPVNISFKDEQIFIRAEAPGMNLEDFLITVSGRNLRISGNKEAPDEENLCFHCSERPFGEFSRLIYIPSDMDTNDIRAKYRDGILTITLTKKKNDGQVIRVNPA